MNDTERTAWLWLMALPRVPIPKGATGSQACEIMDRQIKITACPGKLHTNCGAPLVYVSILLPDLTRVKGSGNSLYGACASTGGYLMTPNPALLDREHFTFRDCEVGGDACWLITPKLLEVPWTPETLMFRSIILRQSDNHVVSVGQRKFFNAGQSPHLYPDPTEHDDWRVSTKYDGSLIIVSRYRGKLIVRTRGTVTVDIHDTGPEVQALLARFPQLRGEGSDGAMVKDLLYSNSLLFEHCGPANRIVVDYPQPFLVLLDVVAHEDCQYWTAKQVDQLALVLGCRRPETHTFGSLAEIKTSLETLSGMEGYVLAYANNAHRVKLKGREYLILHSFKSNVTVSNMLDLWFTKGQPDYDTFQETLVKDYDWECALMAAPINRQINDAYANVHHALRATEQKVKPLRALPRRDAALAIQAQIPRLYQPAAFSLLSNKPVDPKQVRRLMEADLEADYTKDQIVVTP